MNYNICKNCGRRESKLMIIRCKKVCKDCFKLFRSDNRKRCKKGISIPDSFELLGEKKEIKMLKEIFMRVNHG